MENLNIPPSFNACNINIHENYEVEYWTKTLNTNAEVLKKAVAAAGNNADAVINYLKK
jgi:hypothetical protein